MLKWRLPTSAAVMLPSLITVAAAAIMAEVTVTVGSTIRGSRRKSSPARGTNDRTRTTLIIFECVTARPRSNRSRPIARAQKFPLNNRLRLSKVGVTG